MVRLSLINNAKVGFIGLGNMGQSMAKHLMNGGHQLNVLDVNKESCEALGKLGATVSSTPAEVAADSEYIITMLPAHPEVTEVFTGPNGILSAAKPSTVCIDCSTIDIQASRDIAKLCADKSVNFSDAPVSGGVSGAANATLTFMVGAASKEKFELNKPVLELMGKNIVHVGDNGHGLAAKICNNMLLGIQMQGVAETYNLGLNLGLDKKILANIINTSTGKCWASDTMNPVPGALDIPCPSNNEYAGGFGVGLIAKDLGLSQKSSLDTHSVTTMGGIAHNTFKHLTNMGFGGKDFGYVFQTIKNQKD